MRKFAQVTTSAPPLCDAGEVNPSQLRWVNATSVPLIARGVLLVLCAGLSTLTYGTQASAGPALALLVVAAIASLPFPASVPAAAPPVLETIVATSVVAVLGEHGGPFLAYLLVPVVTAGLAAGVGSALLAAGLGTTLITLATFSRGGPDLQAGLVSAIQWGTVLALAGGLAGWARRVRPAEDPAVTDPAYADAHRLLSELHTVARNLSLGLDPATLGAAMVQEVRSLVDARSVVLLVRSPSGRFVPLVGDAGTDADDEHLVLDAWVTASPRSVRTRGRTVLVLPVKMGERVVGAVRVVADRTAEDVAERCRATVAQAGPRLASAMLFDDVRRLATTDERLRVARDIHDGVAQELASIGYALDDAAARAPGGVGDDLLALRRHVQKVTAELRLSIFDLRSGVDDTVGLGTALGEYAQRLGSPAGLVVQVTLDEAPQRLPVGVEVELLRIAQEAVTNVRRHAGAATLWVQVVTAPPRALVRVSDDGAGMGAARRDSLGITGMRERARRIGATIRIEPRAGGGTVVEVTLGEDPPGAPAASVAGAQAGR